MVIGIYIFIIDSWLKNSGKSKTITAQLINVDFFFNFYYAIKDYLFFFFDCYAKIYSSYRSILDKKKYN